MDEIAGNHSVFEGPSLTVGTRPGEFFNGLLPTREGGGGIRTHE